jgi:hypothetical protein
MRGTPFALRCPKCHRGQFGHLRSVKGVRPTGRVDPKITRSKHMGSGPFIVLRTKLWRETWILPVLRRLLERENARLSRRRKQ